MRQRPSLVVIIVRPGTGWELKKIPVNVSGAHLVRTAILSVEDCELQRNILRSFAAASAPVPAQITSRRTTPTTRAMECRRHGDQFCDENVTGTRETAKLMSQIAVSMLPNVQERN